MGTADEFMADVSRSGQEACRPRRLVIKDMIMRNFKSYAGEQRVGPFDKSFSAVVGPNGSGKSNVIDAMLFVFGKRAKQMRLNKFSELIHNSTNRQNLDSAGVSVYFQEIIDLDDGTFKAVPESDFVITRVAFRDNSSKYYINDRASNFTEVTKELKGKGVDLDKNRFLILQGEVEQISLMKPKAQGSHDEGFLEYLEDIIGTNEYVEKIDESYRELESRNEKRSDVVKMVKLAEKERDGLEDMKNEAEAYMLKELSLLKWQEKATRYAHEDTTAKMVDLQENISIIEGNLKCEREKVHENISALTELEHVHSKHMKTQEDLDTDLRARKEEFKQFEREDVKYREDLKHTKQKIKKLKDKLEKDSLKINDIEKEDEDSRNLIAILEESFPQLHKFLLGEEKVLEEILQDSKAETERYLSELTIVRAELEPWEKQLIKHRGKLEVACTEQMLLNKKHEAGRKAFEDAGKQMDDLLGKIETKAAGIETIRSELEKSKLESMKARKEKQEYIREEEALIPGEQAARLKVSELKSALDSERSQGKVLKAILDAKKSNLIQGIHGRLGDFGAIDAKYDVAISTACPRLDCVVVETISAANACFDLLRRENIGIASCLALEKLPEIKNVSTPEGVPRLFDLVEIQDERLKPAFFQATGDTILASDVNQARRIAFKGFQVVTVNGQLWTKVGTMTGGGPIPRGGKMGTSIRAISVSGEDVANAEKELTAMTSSLMNIRQQITDVNRRYEASEKAVVHLGMELAKSQKEIESLNSQHKYLKKQIGSLEAASQPNKDELDRLAELLHIISVEEKEIDKLIQGSKQLKEKALELQSNIENAGGETLREQKFKVNQIQADIDRNNTDTNRLKVQIETGQKTIQKLTKVIEESKNEKERLVKEKEIFCDKFKEIEEKAFAVKEKYDGIQKLIDQHKDLLDKAKSDYNNMKRTVDELRASEIDAEFKLQDMKKLYKELELKEKGYKKRLDSLQTSLKKHIEQIQKDLVDPEKLQATLADDILNNPCGLKRSLEMVVLLEAQLKEMNPNLDTIAEYRGKVSLYNERVEDLSMVTQQRDEIKRQYDDWRKKRLDEFMAGFNSISLKLKEMYQMITLGGDAELELVDSLDPFTEGVVFSVRPPKKSWKNIANLSGGEKTLSSLALVFAMHHYKPTPLYVMDEIDAALDFKNVSIVGHYVKDRTKDAQFIIISLRNNMFELADRLVGIYKTDNCTKSIAIDPDRFVVSGGIAA